MPKSSYNQPVFITGQNASYIADVDSSGAVKTTATIDNVTVTEIWNNASTTITYDAQNNATQVIELRAAETKTTALIYDAQNNATNIVETVT